MGELPEVTPEYFRILVVRELRKAGLDVSEPNVLRRSELPEPERGFVLELAIELSRSDPPWRRRALTSCRRQEGPVRRDVIDDLATRLGAARAEVGLIFSTAEFGADALAAAREHGIALLRLVDGRRVFDTSGWGQEGHYPAWLPAYLVQVAAQDAAGLVRYQLLDAGRPEQILAQFGSPAGPPPQ